MQPSNFLFEADIIWITVNLKSYFVDPVTSIQCVEIVNIVCELEVAVRYLPYKLGEDMNVSDIYCPII